MRYTLHTIRGYTVHDGCDHIFFIGFFGAGKTTLARNLGMLFSRRYVDIDRMAERMCHKTIYEIFQSHGESYFRQAETKALRRLQTKKSLLVSCGGGIVDVQENIHLMHTMGKCVYLEGNLEDSLKQIRYFKNRPDFTSKQEAEQLFQKRKKLYEQAAHYTISITGKSFEQVALEAGSMLWDEGLL